LGFDFRWNFLNEIELKRRTKACAIRMLRLIGGNFLAALPRKGQKTLEMRAPPERHPCHAMARRQWIRWQVEPLARQQALNHPLFCTYHRH
jgi:hypothetical protein